MSSVAFTIHGSECQSRLLEYGIYAVLGMTIGVFVTAADQVQAMHLCRELAIATNAQLKYFDMLITDSAFLRAEKFADLHHTRPPNFHISAMPFDVTDNPSMSGLIGFATAGL